MYQLKIWNAFKDYQIACYRNYLYASEGLRCMGSTWSVLAPLKGLGEDVHIIGGEPHAASTAGTFPEEAREDISAAECAGLGFHCYASAKGGFVTLMGKAINPVGESRSVFEIEYELAQRMSLDSPYPWTNTEEWIDHRLKAGGISLDKLKKQSIAYITAPMEYGRFRRDGFNTTSGKVEIYSQSLRDYDYPPLPENKELDAVFSGQPDLLQRYPLIGTTRRPGVYVHTRFRNVPALGKIEPEALIRINTRDSKSRGIDNGDLTTVQSPNGIIRLRARLTDEVSPGVVVIDFGWGNPGDQGPNVNILTSDEDRDPISSSTPNRRFRCQVAKAND
jgi:anaerobic selenocysteine-containing dehydrogenase